MQRVSIQTILIVTLGLITTSMVNAQQINFSDSWLLLQKKNNSSAAQRANVEHYQHLEKADDALNYPTITLSVMWK